MNSPLTPGDLTRTEWDRFQAALDAFESAWNGSGDVDLLPFLPPGGDRLRLVYLYELVKTDLEMRWRRGQRPLVEDYLKRYVELKQHPSEVPKLLAEEHRARQAGGDNPPFADYQKRFPEHFAEFCRLVGAGSNHASTTGTLRPDASVPIAAPPDPVQMATTRHDPTSPTVPPVLSDGNMPVGGGYKLIRRLGAGQFGEVWLAEAPGGVEVALKIIRRGLEQAEAQRELQALAATKRLRHSYLLPLQAYWSLEDRLIIAMELADGSLTDELKKCGGKVPMDDLLRYMEETAEVLDFLHDQKVMHRDIKPDNILLLRGHVKLADLGLARLMLERSQTATMCGSPAYMAPEVWQGRATRQSDQYSLAASYVHLRLNRMLFPNSEYGIMMAHVKETPKFPELRTPEGKVLLKALAKDPKQRFATCTEFVRALKQAAVPSAQTEQPSRRWVLWISLFASLLVAGLVVAALVWPTEKRPPKLLPDGYEPGEGAVLEEVDGKSYYSHIVYKGTDLPHEYAAHATFILIKPPPGSEVKAPFYLMQHKVSNRFFQAVLRANRDKLPNGWPRKEWEKGAKSRSGDDLPTQGPTPEGWDYADFPVFRVCGNDAERFARLIGAHLPTADEWGVAAGYVPNVQMNDQGPFQDQGNNQWLPGEFALMKGHQGGAMPIGLAKRDSRVVETLAENCVKKCYDMASNGFEWTATAVGTDNKVSFRRVPIDEIQQIKLRLGGQTYKSPTPLAYNGMFVDSENSQGEPEMEAREADISFRLIVETDWPR